MPALNAAKRIISESLNAGFVIFCHFPKYQIKKTECGYLVLNKKTGRTFGTYKNYEYANIIKKILPFYGNNINIRLIEKIAHKEFYKYISYNKRKDVYHVIYENEISQYNGLLEDA